MRALFLHCDSIYFRHVKKAIANAEKISKQLEEKGEKVNEALVAFIAIEADDNETCVKQIVDEIIKVGEQVKAKNYVVYPYVHLSSNPSKPELAFKLLKAIEEELKKAKKKIYRAPFGWYKEFSVSVKGHPLAELSREIKAKAKTKETKETKRETKSEESEALRAEKKAKSYWYILDLDGRLHKLKMKDGDDAIIGFNFEKWPNLEKFSRYEMKKIRAVVGEPPHVKYMRALELVDYEKASDPGNFRFYPKGRLIKSLLEQFVTQKVLEYGALEVETPIMYDFEYPALKAYLNKFPARQYTIETPNKKVFLRFVS